MVELISNGEKLGAIREKLNATLRPYASRAEFEASSIPAPVTLVNVIDGGSIYQLIRDPAGDWQDGGGSKWSAMLLSALEADWFVDQREQAEAAAVAASASQSAAAAAAASAIGAASDAASTLLQAEAAATEAALYDGPKVDTFSGLASVTPAMLAVGGLIRVIETGAVYQRVSAGGDLDYTESGGVRLNVMPAGGALNVTHFGVVGAGGDDTAVFQTAVTAARTRGVMVVDVPAGDFVVNGIALPSGVWLRGVGYERQVGVGEEGTRFIRTSNVVMMTMQGTSFLSGGPMHTNARVSGIYWSGGGLSADIWDMAAVATVSVWDCMFSGTSGRWIRMREVFDSRFTNCRFEGGGSSDGTVAGIDMHSGDTGYEATNQIHFASCVWEAFPGTAVRGWRSGVSYRTNEIYFTSCKIESGVSNTFLMDFDGCTGIHFGPIQLAGKGAAGQTPSAMLRLNDCRAVTGDIHAEVYGATYADWQAYVLVANSKNLNFRLSLYGVAMLSMASAVNHDGNNVTSCRIEVFGRTIVGRGSNIPVIVSRDDEARIAARTGAEPSLSFSRDDIAGEVWSLGRIVADGAGSKFRVVHGSEYIGGWRNDNAFEVRRVAAEPAIAVTRGDFPGESWELGRVVADGVGSKFRVLHNATSAVEVLNDNTLWARMGLLVSAAFNGGPLRMDEWRFWIDAKKRLRLFEGFPGSDTAGNIVQTNANGATASRPASPVTGQQFYDATLSKPIWWSGTNWCDASGTIV